MLQDRVSSLERASLKARRTNFDQGIVGVTSEVAVRAEGDDRVDGGHVQDAQAVKACAPSARSRSGLESGITHICRCSFGTVYDLRAAIALARAR